MEDRGNATAPGDRKPRTVHCEEMDEELAEESHGGEPMHKILLARESATERFRGLKRRLLAKG